MKKNAIIILILVGIFLAVSSCEKDISIDLPRPEDKLVVEGYIINGEFPYVFLTKNAGYFDMVDSASLITMMVFSDSVKITVSDGTNSTQLSPALLPLFPYLGYTCNDFKGEVGKTYRLDIEYDNRKYFAHTTIPTPIDIDSVWFSPFKNQDTLGLLNFSFFDPPETDNYYAIHTKVEGEQLGFYKPFMVPHIRDDMFDNGKEIFFLGLTKGDGTNSFFFEEQEDEEWVNSVVYGKNTIVNLRLSSLDAEHYQFWNSYYRHFITWGNPFTNPASIKSNIKGDPSLGIWGGYGTNIVRAHITDSAKVNILR
ncbi:MAG: DUF4249 domain-containing protein [Bacteroidales bacterium]|nr:DUF4249 domain-containing protein [Bacteroidales bacterium]